MKRLSPEGAQARQRWPLLLLGFLLLALFVPIFLIHSDSFYCSDDYYYTWFWKDGFRMWIRNNIYHYLHFNGRAFVHAVLQTVLWLGPVFFAGFAALAYALLCSLLPRLFGGRESSLRQKLLVGIGFCTGFFLLSQRAELGRAMLWISAWFNYIFPATLILCTVAYLRRPASQRGWRIGVGLVLCFLCGATTEQSGVITIALLGLLWLQSVIADRRAHPLGLIYAVCAFAGLMTIFLSPATRNRASASVSLAMFLNTVERLSVNTVGPHRSLGIFIFFCASKCLFSRKNGLSKLHLLYAPMGAALAVLYFVPDTLHLCTALLMAFFGVTVLSALLLIFRSKYVFAGFYELALILGWVMIPITNNAAIRLGLPLSFGLLLLSAWMFSDLAEQAIADRAHGGRVGALALLLAGLALGGCIFVPTFGSYHANHLVFEQMRSTLRQAEDGDAVLLSKEYDPRCMYTDPDHNPYVQRFIKLLYDIPNAELTFSNAGGELTPEQVWVRADDVTVDCVLTWNGESYASLRTVIGTTGNWFCRANFDHIDFTFDGGYWVYSDGTLFRPDGSRVATPTPIIYLDQTYLPFRFYKDALGLDLKIVERHVEWQRVDD